MAFMSVQSRFLRGPAHPLCLAAAAVLVWNDHIGKSAFHGFVTGKLSDVAWLIVTPVALAAVLAWAGARRPAPWSLGVVGAAFTLLQVWPPLGDVWATYWGWHHVADVGDLITLPALFLVPLCWRPQTIDRVPKVRLALVSWASVATSPTQPICDDRYPADGAVDVDPNGPLGLDWGVEQGFFGTPDLATETGAIDTGIRLVDEAGTPVDLIIVPSGAYGVVICPDGGLEPGATYTWWVDDFADVSPNAPAVYDFALSGWQTFTTAEVPSSDRITSAASCRGLPNPALAAVCPYEGYDTGDSGDTADSGGAK